jgi:hypothetical protein
MPLGRACQEVAIRKHAMTTSVASRAAPPLPKPPPAFGFGKWQDWEFDAGISGKPLIFP